MKLRENKSLEELHKRLAYILDKVEWNQEDMEWMLMYLERGDDELMEIMMGNAEKTEMGEKQDLSDFGNKVWRGIAERLKVRY